MRHSVPQIVPGIQAAQWHLSKDGIELAELLAKQLEYLEPNIIFSSPEPKAHETGAILAKHLEIPQQTEKDIREHDLSSNKILLQSDFEASVSKFFNYPGRLVFGNESAEQTLQRFTGAVNKLRLDIRDKSAILVTHGRILSLFFSEITGVQPYEFWNSIGMPAYAIFELPKLTLIQLVNSVKIED